MKDEPKNQERRTGNVRPLSASSYILRPSSFRLVVAGHRLDGGDDLLVGDLVGGAGEAGVATIHEDRPIALRVAAQRVDQLLALSVVERTEIHRDFSLRKGTSNFPSVGKSFPSVRRSDLG